VAGPAWSDLMKKPDFTSIDFELRVQDDVAPSTEAQASWLTPEQIAIKSFYTADDLRTLEHL